MIRISVTVSMRSGGASTCSVFCCASRARSPFPEEPGRGSLLGRPSDGAGDVTVAAGATGGSGGWGGVAPTPDTFMVVLLPDRPGRSGSDRLEVAALPVGHPFES